MKYHVFFTAKYSTQCLDNGRFGATSVNSLVDVSKGDTAFLFDGSKWKIFGPLKILSEKQFYETDKIFGSNKRGVVNYPNRIAFDTQDMNELDLNILFSIEKNYYSPSYLLNRTLLSVITANKQVHSTPLTIIEGKYLESQLLERGVKIETNGGFLSYNKKEFVINNVIRKRKPKSEAVLEMLLMTYKPSPTLFNEDHTLVFNQFILGIQRQIDILAISKKEIIIFEIKKRDNLSNPYIQVKEYLDYLVSDYRLEPYHHKEKDHKAIVLLEVGNRYLNNNYIQNTNNIQTYSFFCDSNYCIHVNGTTEL